MSFCRFDDVIARERVTLWMLGGGGVGLVGLVTALAVALFG